MERLNNVKTDRETFQQCFDMRTVPMDWCRACSAPFYKKRVTRYVCSNLRLERYQTVDGGW